MTRTPRMKRFHRAARFVSTLFFGQMILAAAAHGGQDGSPPAPSRYNILFIMSDDHTTQAIGTYGSRLSRLDPTPALDQIAREGTRFDNVFATNALCSPSRATIISGQHSQANGVLDLSGQLPREKQHLPRLMSGSGYETAIIGKWHLQAEPAAFDYYSVMPAQGSYLDPSFHARGDKAWPSNRIHYEGHSTDVVSDQAIDWLASRSNEKPFFLMLHFKAPHDMFEYAPRYEDYLADTEIPEPASMYAQPNFGSVATRGLGTSISRRDPSRNMGKWMGIDDDVSEPEYTHLAYQEYVKRYLRTVKGVDDNIARVIAALKKANLYDKTIIIYTSDQGIFLGEHDLVDKRWMYDEAMRMPFILRHPDKKEAPKRSDLLIDNTDFAPLILDLAGVEAPDYMQGRSFSTVLDGKEPQEWRTAVYNRFWMHRAYHDVPGHFGIRTKKYKLIFFYGVDYKERSACTDEGGFKPGVQRKEYYDCANVRAGEAVPRSHLATPAAWEFYDLQNDPEELNNRYGDPEYADIIAELKVELARLRQDLNETDERFPDIQEIIDTSWN